MNYIYEQMLNEMIERQREYDSLVFKAHEVDGYSGLTLDQVRSALMDEIGELNHEIKADWCWWKKTQKPKVGAKVLEEYADVVHFVLMITIGFQAEEELIDGFNKAQLADVIIDGEPVMITDYDWSVFDFAPERDSKGLPVFDINHLGWSLWCVTRKLGFKFENLYHMYLYKNDENRDRVKRGY